MNTSIYNRDGILEQSAKVNSREIHPKIIVVSGLPGSGKSYFAKHLAHRLNYEYFNTDLIRKELMPTPTYTLDEKQRVYQEMQSRADVELKSGRSVILDGNFSFESQRKPIIQWIKNNSYTLFWLEIVARDQLVQERLKNTRPDSDADYSVYINLKKQADPLNLPHLRLESTNQNLTDMLKRAIPYISRNKNDQAAN